MPTVVKIQKSTLPNGHSACFYRRYYTRNIRKKAPRTKLLQNKNAEFDFPWIKNSSKLLHDHDLVSKKWTRRIWW